MTAAATAITVFHRVPDTPGFDTWLAGVVASAGNADGFVAARVSVHHDPRLDPAVEVTLRTEDLLHTWLDGSSRKAVLREGESLGYFRASSDLVIVEGSVPPVGVGVFLHSVAVGKEADFEAAQVRLAEKTSDFAGCEGTVLFPPDQSGEWMSVLRFRRGQQLAAWMRSQERAEALPDLRANLTRDFSEVTQTAPFGSTVRTDNGETKITPGWKIAMLILLTLYPTVMLLSRFFGPALNRLGVEPGITLWISQIISVAALQWLLMPAASRAFRRWLDPIDGAGPRVSLAGAAAIVVLYAATLLLFASVKSLQFWDYAS